MPSSKNLNFKMALIALAILSLGGCNNEKKRAELEAYVKEVKSRNIKEIEPLPEMKPFETFTYKNFNQRSPFSPPVEVVAKRTVLNGIRPDINRRKEILESFPLDSLRMVGTVEKEGKRWALIVDNKGTVHRISKGNYIGQHEGRVDQITEEKVVVTEIVPDPSIGWRERKSSLTLLEAGNNSEANKAKK